MSGIDNAIVDPPQAGAGRLTGIGDNRKTYPVVLTEPEINAIHAAYGFCEAAAKAYNAHPAVKTWWDHYGPTFTALSVRLGKFDDGDAPYENSALPPDGGQTKEVSEC